MHKKRFSKYTQKLRKSFPTWSKIRKDPNAIGSQFLSVIGLTLDDVEWMLDYAYSQVYIGTADLNQIDIIYKTRIPNSISPDTKVRFSSHSHILHRTESITEFLTTTTPEGEYSILHYDSSYYLDFTNRYLYVKHPYGQDDTYKDGYILLTLLDDNENEIFVEKMPLMVHHVWNFFDEFGLLLNTPRLHGEKNASYKERILDVFRRPSGSHYRGLLNGMARDLGLVHEIQWEDAGNDLALKHPRIDHNSIFIDNEPYLNELTEADDNGRLTLPGTEEFRGQKRTVRYIAGIQIEELHDRDNEELMSRLHSVDGDATRLLKYYVETIRDQVPIMWGQWRWDQGFWNISEEEMSGYGYIPTMFDGKIEGWKHYTPKEV